MPQVTIIEYDFFFFFNVTFEGGDEFNSFCAYSSHDAAYEAAQLYLAG